jgi:hypothetical protein
LLPFEPALETAEVKNMPAGQFLWSNPVHCARIVLRVPRSHFFTADNAGVLSSKILLGGVGIAVHFLDSFSVTHQSAQSLDEVSRCHEKVSHNMNRQSIEGQEHKEEYDVYAKFNQV